MFFVCGPEFKISDSKKSFFSDFDSLKWKFQNHVIRNKLRKEYLSVNQYRRKRPKVDASIFNSALSHTRRWDAAEKREENSVSIFGRFHLWTSFESSPVSVKDKFFE